MTNVLVLIRTSFHFYQIIYIYIYIYIYIILLLILTPATRLPKGTKPVRIVIKLDENISLKHIVL